MKMRASKPTKKMRTSKPSKHAKYVHVSCLPYVVVSDLLPDVLCRLPVKSLIQFCLVCKQRHTLITKDSRIQRRLLSNKKQAAIGLQIQPAQNWFYEIKYLHSSSAAKKMIIPPLREACFVVQSCNGLLLCSNKPEYSFHRMYYVCNPLTKQYLCIAEPHTYSSNVCYLSLAFDPSKSPYYKIIAAVGYHPRDRIRIYSSDTRLWRLSDCDTEGASVIMSGSGVYWNGAINWVSASDMITSLYLNLENEILKPLPSLPRNKYRPLAGNNNAYFGESHGHFHFVEIGIRRMEVYEMKTDYSEWFIMYNINLFDIAKGEFSFLKVKILSVICGEDETDTFLVLRVPGKVIRFDLATNTCQKLHDVEGENRAPIAFHYIKSLCSV